MGDSAHSAASRADKLIAGAAAALAAAAVLGVAHQEVEHSDSPASVVVESHMTMQVGAEDGIVVPDHMAI